MTDIPRQTRRGRGSRHNPDNRFHRLTREDIDDGWENLEQPLEPLPTYLAKDTSRTVISYNQSPDVPFDRSINPYRGCEHGCVYCFARPTHAWLDLSPGLDFETRLFYKHNAAALLRAELGHKGYRCAPIALGINTDAYQPVERRLGITREILQVLADFQHPCTIVTKSALIERDLDLLVPMAEAGLLQVMYSVTTLDAGLARSLEPRAAAPHRRLESLHRLHAAGIPVGVLVAPVIPALNEAELERILEACRAAGAQSAGYVLLRLPHEVKELFRDWLQAHVPLKADHVMSLIRQSRGGQEYQAEFGTRMRGTGSFAELLAQRFRLAYRRLGFASLPALNTERFRVPAELRPQLELF